MLSKTRKQRIIKEFKHHETDTGSSGVQIALLSKRIDELTSHLKTHKKDIHSRRGLLQMVADRRALLSYLKKHDQKAYARTTKKLGLKTK
ncbi:MAG: 30S ribosomal protein S15 [Candidatus Vogelbacteria bacterium]|nr:30S ribosomal protein S15 [Candidatus Vogelbacteria bacterium]